MIANDLLAILCCPETHQRLEDAGPELVDRLNQQIADGKLRNRGGQILHKKIQGGLVRQDRQWVYPVRNEIAVMLIEEALPLT